MVNIHKTDKIFADFTKFPLELWQTIKSQIREKKQT